MDDVVEVLLSVAVWQIETVGEMDIDNETEAVSDGLVDDDTELVEAVERVTTADGEIEDVLETVVVSEPVEHEVSDPVLGTEREKVEDLVEVVMEDGDNEILDVKVGEPSDVGVVVAVSIEVKD